MRMIFVMLCALMVTGAVLARADEANSILKDLLEKGVTFPDGATVTLPAPTLVDGLNETQQTEALQRIVDRNHPLAEMEKTSVDAIHQFFLLSGTPSLVAPEGFSDSRKTVWLKEHFQGPISARRIDLFFFVHGPLSVIGEKDFLKGQAGADQEESPLYIFNHDELAERKIPAVEADSGKGFGGAKFRLFDTVEVSGGGKFQKTISEESMLLAVMLDDHFAADPLYPNQWRKLQAKGNGKPIPGGAANPYTACGAYVKATSLKSPTGMVLIEYHLVFDEPRDWFNGANLLSSKLGIATQKNIKSFRVNLARRLKDQESASGK